MWRNRIARLVSSVLVLGAAAGAGHESPGGHGEEHLRRVMATYRVGDFEGAWRAYRDFFEHPHKNGVDPHVYVECFGYVRCPALGALGSVLGRTAEDAGPFRSFCPKWRTPDDPEEARAAREAEDILIGEILGSCEQWVRRTTSMLPLQRREGRPETHTVPLRGAARDLEDPRPHVDMDVRGQSAHALVDTGATITELNVLLGVSPIERVWVDRIDGSRYEMDFGRLERLGLHERVYQDVPAALAALTWTDDGEVVPASFGSTLGMDVLLRHEAACFDLRGQRLHLGRLGPCAQGVLPHRAWLHGSHSLYVSVPATEGDAMPATLDTGATQTYCSEAFLTANGGSAAFRFGEHAALAGECVTDPDVAFSGVGSGQDQILIGMDVLGRLDAFGWRLNPLELHFLPADPVAVPDANGGNSENVVVRQKRSDGRGG